jgi:hypothetical protein
MSTKFGGVDRSRAVRPGWLFGLLSLMVSLGAPSLPAEAWQVPANDTAAGAVPVAWSPLRSHDVTPPSIQWPEFLDTGAESEMSVPPVGPPVGQEVPFAGLENRFFSQPSTPEKRDWIRRWESVPISLGATWIAEPESRLATYTVGLKFPILLGSNSPPPIVKAGFAQTAIEASRLGVSGDLFEYSVGVSSVRQLNDHWTLRLLIGGAFASDHENTSSDAWQFRGGVIGIYRSSERWQWTCGAIALGRSDLPAVPAIGAVWTPNEWSRWDLLPPNPRANFLLRQDAHAHDWLYLGGGFNGSTWGVEAEGWGDNRLTYRDLRLAVGWQRTPPAAPGQPFVRGRKYNLELAYAFSREFELEQRQLSIPLSDSWILRIESEF